MNSLKLNDGTEVALRALTAKEVRLHLTAYFAGVEGLSSKGSEVAVAVVDNTVKFLSAVLGVPSDDLEDLPMPDLKQAVGDVIRLTQGGREPKEGEA